MISSYIYVHGLHLFWKMIESFEPSEKIHLLVVTPPQGPSGIPRPKPYPQQPLVQHPNTRNPRFIVAKMVSSLSGTTCHRIADSTIEGRINLFSNRIHGAGTYSYQVI